MHPVRGIHPNHSESELRASECWLVLPKTDEGRGEVYTVVRGAEWIANSLWNKSVRKSDILFQLFDII